MNIRFVRVQAVVGVLLSVFAMGAQTVITPPNNKYSPAQDVELGRKAALEGDQQPPMLREEEVTSSVVAIGRRLVESIPQELEHPGSAPVPDEPLDSGHVALPWSTYLMYTEGDLFRVSVPSNWRELPRSNTRDLRARRGLQ